MRGRIIYRVGLYVALALVAAPALAQTASELNAAGVDLYNAKDWRAALGYFLSAYEAGPENEVVRRNLCNTYQAIAAEFAKQADFASAADHLELAISIDATNASPLIQFGSYYLRLDLASDAAYRLEEAVELDPENVDANYLLGEAYYKQNNLHAALAQWEWVLEVQPNRAGLREKIEKAYREEATEYAYGSKGSLHFQVSYAPDMRGDLSTVLTTLEHAYRDVGRKFGGVYPPTPVQVIVNTADDFAKTTLLGEHVGAIYDGKIRVPLQDRQGNAIDPAELHRRLYHEYTHVVVRFLAADNVPWWLNEGLAETFSNDLTGADVDLLRRAFREGVLFSLADLDQVNLRTGSPDALRLAYTQAHATVRFLYTRFGKQTLTALMTALAEGIAPDEAVTQTYRRTYDMIEKEVAAGFGRSGR